MRRILLIALAASLAGCSGASPDSTAQAATPDELTRRQKDSIISTLPIPGAGAVGKALRASDLAKARADRHDAIR